MTDDASGRMAHRLRPPPGVRYFYDENWDVIGEEPYESSAEDDDAILAGILRRILAEGRLSIAENVLDVAGAYLDAPLSDTEQAAILRALEDG